MLTIPLPRAHPPLAPSAAPDPVAETAKIDVTGLNFYYGGRRALEQITVQIRPNEVTALIGPSGCGKSTFLRTLNRMNDIVAGARVEEAVSDAQLVLEHSGRKIAYTRLRATDARGKELAARMEVASKSEIRNPKSEIDQRLLTSSPTGRTSMRAGNSRPVASVTRNRL